MTSPAPDRLSEAEIADLHALHAEELRRFLWGVVGEASLVQDIVQITFRKLVEVGHETQVESRKAWLFQVAYREALAQRRRSATQKRVLENLQQDPRRNEDGSPADPLVAQETAESVRQAINELSSELQQVLRMRIYEDKTFAQIAQQLDIPLGTALGRMRNAMNKLRGKLAWIEREP
ncbi:ECF RNA polymerase sigma factor SigL [Bremerella volcania]|uniref:ECF RNA polymerase sigma factor SigL n=1 Tax=Bremerella volcania TaxID=2527984 RepID=A0A518C425_9BACT|nr:sigma-70 family RNA polymerase sigma factor [Bremerella volcania]QDU73983.1 ECF RNA polymerase sigma factor SigL [Bremerella volcania]